MIRLENGFEQYCKSFPKSVQNAPKLVHATVLDASLEHPGHHRAFYSKTVSGDNSFLGGLSVAFGRLGFPKASAMPFGRTFLGTILTKYRKRGIHKGIPKLMLKKDRKCMPKGFQNDAKMKAKINENSYFSEKD